jgi:peptide chain release factor 2
LPISPLAAPSCGGIFDFDVKAEKLEELNHELEDPKVWDNAERAQALGKEKKLLEGVVLTLQNVAQSLTDAQDLFDMAKDEGDEDTLEAVDADLASVELYRYSGRRRWHRGL